MGLHYLEKLFNPTSIAVIGASNKRFAVGQKIFSNLLHNGFRGKLYAVNPKHKKIQGKPCYPSIASIHKPIDLVIIATPAATIPNILRECGEQGIHMAVILSAGFSEAGNQGKKLQQTLLTIAAQYQIRILGPNCLGIIRPHIGVNATFSNNAAATGNLALISQSGALCTAILDWAVDQHIGFSTMISVGNEADIDFGDILDYLALDQQTNSILLYIEGIRNARNFMSGLRAAARIKPVIVIKAGRHTEGSRAAVSHTGAIVGIDDVFSAALRRAGAVRVTTIEQLFSAAQILSANYRTQGNRLGIITNGGGPGVMAADQAEELHVNLPQLSAKSLRKFDKALPAYWSHHNPVDILGDATPERYQFAITTCLQDPNIDGILTLLTPQAMSQPSAVARKVIIAAKKSTKPVLCCWLGGEQVEAAWQLFAKSKIPYFNTPESGIAAFSYLADYQYNQELLLQVPPPLSYEIKPDIEGARLIIESVLAEHRKILTPIESKAILTAFGIPVTQTLEARTANDALVAAESIGFPVAIKINSPDITHKQDVGGVQLNITNADAVRSTFNTMIENATRHQPSAKILGVTVERMYKSINDRELMIGVLRDQVFGPVISFGAGGSMVEVMQDRAVALPPLNSFIANALITHTRIAKLLGTFRNMPAVNLSAIVMILLRVSAMVCELPQIQEMDINPLIANENGVMAVDARIVVDFTPPSLVTYGHMAIHPYPNHLTTIWQLADGTDITIRPIRPEDAELDQAFVKGLSAKSKRLRFMKDLHELTPVMLMRFTQIDYDREMALIATYKKNNKEVCIGVARYVLNPDQTTCEFNLVVADSWQKKGLGSKLMNCLIEVAKAKGLQAMTGEILANNTDMLLLAQNLGFTIDTNTKDPKIKTATKLLTG